MELIGYIIIALWVLFTFTGRKRDRRFRNGYKNNEKPMKFSTYIKISGAMWLIAFVCIFIGRIKEPSIIKSGLPIYLKPDYKSEVIYLSNPKLEYYKKDETKYFVKFEFKDSLGNDTSGYILKDSLR